MQFNFKNQREAQIARDYLEKLIKKEQRCEVKKMQEKRTDPQNRYLHVLFGYFSAFFGYTMEEAKIIVKRHLGYVYEKNGEKFLRSTADFTTEEMIEFINKFRKYSNDNECYLPTAEEYYENPGQIEEFIRQNSFYINGGL